MKHQVNIQPIKQEQIVADSRGGEKKITFYNVKNKFMFGSNIISD